MPQATEAPPKASKKSKKENQESLEGQEKTLINVKRSRTYKIVEPKEEKLLNDDFRVPDNKLGRAARNYVILNMAKEEIVEDCRDAGQKLVAEFDEARRTDLKIQVGKNVFTLEKHHIAAKEEIKIKK